MTTDNSQLTTDNSQLTTDCFKLRASRSQHRARPEASAFRPHLQFGVADSGCKPQSHSTRPESRNPKHFPEFVPESKPRGDVPSNTLAAQIPSSSGRSPVHCAGPA